METTLFVLTVILAGTLGRSPSKKKLLKVRADESADWTPNKFPARLFLADADDTVQQYCISAKQARLL